MKTCWLVWRLEFLFVLKKNVTSGLASGFWSICSVSQAFSTMAGAVSRWYPMNTSPTVSSCLFSSCLENQIENSFLPPSHSLLQPPLPQPTPLSLYVSFMQQYTCETCSLAVSYTSLTYAAFVVNWYTTYPCPAMWCTGMRGVVLTKSAAHCSSWLATSSCSGVMMLFTVRKCFSRRLISGMGNLSYTMCFSATTISLEVHFNGDKANKLMWCEQIGRNIPRVVISMKMRTKEIQGLKQCKQTTANHY